MSSKSGAAGEILFFESEKHHGNGPLKMDTLKVSVFDAFIQLQTITSVTDLHREDIALHSAYKINYHKVLFLELEAPKCPSIERYVC